MIPLVENAFKHGIDGEKDSFIDIIIEVVENRLILMVSNSLPETKNDNKDDVSGIGIKNLKRRLKLLYPDKHKIISKKEEKRYISELTIELKSDELYNS